MRPPELLTRPDPILFYKHLVLYEDFLHDHGVVQLSLKIRVMPTCWFLLLRHWLRIDGVLTRVTDTRCFHEFGTDCVVREYSVKEQHAAQSMASAAMDPHDLGPDTAMPGASQASMMRRVHARMASTADEAAEQLRPLPEKEFRCQQLRFPAAAGGSNGGADPAGEAAVADEAKPGLVTFGSAWSHEMDDYVECLAAAPGGSLVAVGCLDGGIMLIEQPAGRQWTIDGHTGGTLSLAFAESGVLASSGEDGTVRLWEVQSSTQLATVELQGVCADYISVGGKRLACVQLVSAFGDGSRRLAVAVGRAAYVLGFDDDWQKSVSTAQLPAVCSTITAMQYHQSSSSLYVSCYGSVTVWGDCHRARRRMQPHPEKTNAFPEKPTNACDHPPIPSFDLHAPDRRRWPLDAR